MTALDISLTLATFMVVGGTLAAIGRRLVHAQVRREVSRLPEPSGVGTGVPTVAPAAMPRWPLRLVWVVAVFATAALVWVGTRPEPVTHAPARFIPIDPFATSDEDVPIVAARLMRQTQEWRRLTAAIEDRGVVMRFIAERTSDLASAERMGREAASALAQSKDAVRQRLGATVACARPPGGAAQPACALLQSTLRQLEAEAQALDRTLAAVARVRD